MEETFSPSQDMTEYVGGGGKLLEEQDSLLKAWTAIRIMGWCSFTNEKVGWCSYSKMLIKGGLNTNFKR